MSEEASVTSKKFAELKHALKQLGRLEIVLISNSMAPVLATGAKAQIEPVQIDELRDLDFVVFRAGEDLVCHVVWGYGFFPAANGERTIVTRGLANPRFDEPVKESNILGRVVSHRISKFQFVRIAMATWLKAKLKLKLKV